MPTIAGVIGLAAVFMFAHGYKLTRYVVQKEADDEVTPDSGKAVAMEPASTTSTEPCEA